jgi:protein tyrosine phosphatase (PTP) superfamily phosphohydrolase (DUF442 family)
MLFQFILRAARLFLRWHWKQMNKITDIYNFLEINKSLSTSGQPTEAQLSALAKEGYELIINLALHDDPRYSLPDETSYIESIGMQYIHIPVQFDAPLKSNLVDFFNTMESNKGKKIHIHCAANMRVSAFLGLYLLVRERRTRKEAFEPLQSIWEPDPVWSSFIDSMLEEFAS